MTSQIEETEDRLKVLFRQEETFYLTTDYLGELVQQKQEASATSNSNSASSNSTSSSSTGSNSKMLNQHWREVMCEWAYHVVDHFDFPRDIVSSCMSLLDRYLATHLTTSNNPDGIPKHVFQLLAMTCLYIAVKLDQPRMLSLDTMAHLSRGTFTKEQMRAMETDVLNTLQWHVHPPTPYTFLSYFMQIMNTTTAKSSLPGSSSKVYEMSRYFVELSVLDYYFVGKRSSTIAIAALLNALEDQRCYDVNLSCFVTPGQEDMVQDCRSRLRSLYSVPDQSVFGDSQDLQQAASAASAAQDDFGRTQSPTCVSQAHIDHIDYV